MVERSVKKIMQDHSTNVYKIVALSFMIGSRKCMCVSFLKAEFPLIWIKGLTHYPLIL